ncbi:hypothetical protein DK389_06655 [Methylobacterium durans]|uniref:Uncharacterized protein n=2 Tax=Methylobacterium durans TaxID=2202825 RepID=A0A2U8W4S0_9HYPH|nr:hypothetical protein DK389_06655 [Methylobacterium durans]
MQLTVVIVGLGGICDQCGMKIQEGRFYRTRDGRTAGPLAARGGRSLGWEGRVEGFDGIQSWTGDGYFLPSCEQHSLDLVKRAQSSVGIAMDQMTLDDYRRGIAKLRNTF